MTCVPTRGAVALGALEASLWRPEAVHGGSIPAYGAWKNLSTCVDHKDGRWCGQHRRSCKKDFVRSRCRETCGECRKAREALCESWACPVSSWSIASHWAKFESVPEHDVQSVANASGWHYLHLRVLPSEWRPGAHTVACSGSGQKTCVRRGETKAKVKVLSIVTC